MRHLLQNETQLWCIQVQAHLLLLVRKLFSLASFNTAFDQTSVVFVGHYLRDIQTKNDKNVESSVDSEQDLIRLIHAVDAYVKVVTVL